MDCHEPTCRKSIAEHFARVSRLQEKERKCIASAPRDVLLEMSEAGCDGFDARAQARTSCLCGSLTLTLGELAGLGRSLAAAGSLIGRDCLGTFESSRAAQVPVWADRPEVPMYPGIFLGRYLKSISLELFTSKYSSNSCRIL